MTDSSCVSLVEMTIKPEGELTIQSAQDNKVLWLKALADTHSLVVDLSLVERIDVTGIQLLLSLRRYAHQQGKVCRLMSPSGAIHSLIRLLGLEQQLLDECM